MAKYYQRKDGLFETSRTINGKRVMFRGHSCREVDQKILAYQERRERGRKLGEIIDEWYAAKSDSLRETTRAAYESVSKLIPDQYLNMHMAEIRPLDVKRMVHDVERLGYARGTMQIYVTIIKQACSWAVLSGDCDVSPATEITISRGLPAKKREALTEREEALVEQYRGDHWLVGMMLLYTGCRRGELCALNWQDIDYSDGCIHITKKVSWPHGNPVLEYRLKSENGKRDIPLLSPLAAVLPRGKLGAIFTATDGKYLSNSAWNKLWREYRIGCGLTEDITAHCFRHSFMTRCYEAGIDTASAAAFLGDTEEVARGVYTTLRQKHKDGAARQLDAYLTGDQFDPGAQVERTVNVQ